MKIMTGNQFALTVYAFSMMLPATVNEGQITSIGGLIALLSLLMPLQLLAEPAAVLRQIVADPIAGLLFISAFLSNVAFLTAAALHAMRSHKRALVASVLSVAAMVHCRIAMPTPPPPGGIFSFGEFFEPAYSVWLASGLLMLCVTLHGYLKRPTAASTTSPAG